MRIPRNVTGDLLVRRLPRLGYQELRQRGSHKNMRTDIDGRYTVQVPMHKPIKTGMLESLLKKIAAHHHISVDELIEKLDL